MALSIEDLVNQAGFIFRGTVEKPASATMAAVPVSERTAVVFVEATYRAPEAVGDQTGRSITVELASSDAPVGLRAVFFATGWIYGESIAVQELGRRDANDDEIRRELEAAEARTDDRRLRERLSEAAAIVVGAVMEMEVDREQGGRSLSEHDAQWWFATVAIESVEKGDLKPGGTVRLAFPSSDDIVWYRVPRPTAAQDAIWLLHRGAVGGLPRDVFTALDPFDIRPRDELRRVRELIEQTP